MKATLDPQLNLYISNKLVSEKRKFSLMGLLLFPFNSQLYIHFDLNNKKYTVARLTADNGENYKLINLFSADYDLDEDGYSLKNITMEADTPEATKLAASLQANLASTLLFDSEKAMINTLIWQDTENDCSFQFHKQPGLKEDTDWTYVYQ